MEYLDKNYVVFDYNSTTKYKYLYGKIKSNTNDLQKVFGIAMKTNRGINKWKFKMNDSNFTIYDNQEHNDWYLSSNTNDKNKIKNFIMFLTEARRAIRGARSTHKNIPIFTSETYQLKNKIALYRIPPIKPPTGIKIYEEIKKIPRKNKDGILVFNDHKEFKPNLTPKEVINAGVFGGTYFRTILSGITGKTYVDVWKEFPSDWFKNLDIEKYLTSQVINASINKYKIKMGGNLDMWESSGWITEIDPYGWFQWYCRFYLGRRTTDDLRQIKRWLGTCGNLGRFRITLMRKIFNEKTSYCDSNTGAIIRQSLLQWSYELTKKDYLDYVKTL
jgi:hypothetical protein